MEDKLIKLKRLQAIQGIDGNWDHNNYRLGVYNGIELSIAILENRDPILRTIKHKNVNQDRNAQKLTTFIFKEQYKRIMIEYRQCFLPVLNHLLN